MLFCHEELLHLNLSKSGYHQDQRKCPLYESATFTEITLTRHLTYKTKELGQTKFCPFYGESQLYGISQRDFTVQHCFTIPLA